MKKIYFPVILLISFFSVASFTMSCKKNFFTATSTTNLSQTTIFTDSANAEGFLANIYANAGFASSPSRFTYTTLSGSVIPCGGLDAACDEAEISHTYSTTALAFALGSVNAGNVTDDAFKTCYAQIRTVNQIYANLSVVPLKSANKVQMKAEAQFLRAWFYFILLEHYGGVPIIGNNIYTYTQFISEHRRSFADCVNYITSQCDSAAAILPTTQTGAAYGRASAGACLALKARVLLYAASPLFNNPGGLANKTPQDIATAQTIIVSGKSVTVPADTIKSYVGYLTYDQHRWQLAENAANAVIGLGVYKLGTDSTNVAGYGEEGAFQEMFTERPNTEYIFQEMEPNANTILENLFQPPSRTGSNGSFPYQGLVDAFPMANGKAITDPTSGYNPNNPYANRDPRLRYSIIYDQSLLGNRTPNGQINGYSPVNIFIGSYNGNTTGTDAVYQGTPTGYYCNKMLDPQAISQGFFAVTNRCLPLIRYAEIGLDYAEAANEFEGPTANVYQAVNAIRQRAGIPGLPTGLTKDQMRTAIQNERQVELAYEGHRFFDVRRWVIADQTENINASGMEVDRNGASVTYKQFIVRQHTFHTQMYLWPFPQTEIGKGAGLAQNPGY